MKIRTLVCFVILGVTTCACRVLAEEKSKAAASTNKPPVTTAMTASNEAVVARVNGSEIRRSELDTAVRALAVQMARRGRQASLGSAESLQHDVLDDLIGRELLLQEGSKHPGADVEQKTQTQIELAKKQLGGDEQFKSTLAESGITPVEYAKRVHDNVIIKETIQDLVDKQDKIYHLYDICL